MHTTTPPADTSAPTGTHSRGPRIFPGGDPQPLTARRIRRTRPAPNIAHAPHRGRKTMPAETETESGKSRATRNVAAAFSGLFSRAPVRGIRAEHARNDFVRAFLRPDNDETDKRGLSLRSENAGAYSASENRISVFAPTGSGRIRMPAKPPPHPPGPAHAPITHRSPPLHLPSAATAPETNGTTAGSGDRTRTETKTGARVPLALQSGISPATDWKDNCMLSP